MYLGGTLFESKLDWMVHIFYTTRLEESTWSNYLGTSCKEEGYKNCKTQLETAENI